eukprot:4498771-Amphidinium_carterae.1
MPAATKSLPQRQSIELVHLPRVSRGKQIHSGTTTTTTTTTNNTSNEQQLPNKNNQQVVRDNE